MRSVVVYESMYGNSRRVAQRVGDVLSQAGPASVVPVSGATRDLVAAADLLVVGGPTHVHSMSSARSRAAAHEAATAEANVRSDKPLVLDEHSDDPGLRDWFKTLPDGGGVLAAAFDTRLDARAMLTGRASRAIAKKLARHGYHLVAEPQSFLVDKGTVLLPSEEDRAAQWALSLLVAAQAEDVDVDWPEK